MPLSREDESIMDENVEMIFERLKVENKEKTVTVTMVICVSIYKHQLVPLKHIQALRGKDHPGIKNTSPK